MSTLRLTFLYPHLFRTARLGEPAAQAAARGSRRRPRRATPTLPCLHASPFASATTARQTPALKRHGKAVEPAPLHIEPDAPAAGDAKARPEQGGGGGKADNEAVRTEGKGAKDTGKAAEPTNAQPGQAEEAKAQQAPGSDSRLAAATDDSPPSTKSGPMDTILHMGPPGGYEEAAPGPGRRTVPPPHMAASPYVHHFDSYSLVKQLEAGGWTAVQAITAMKAIRGILAANLDVAQDGLVSKSDVENETYLFRAACSELSAEVRNNRRVADGQMRQQRTTLQHEVDILTQGMSQEVLTLNDNVRGMFNDRRMAVREEQKAAESAIQQISYKISILLNSDARSEIEAVRWVLIRRSVLGILFMAILTLGSLRYASYRSHEKAREQEMLLMEAGALKKEAARQDAGPDVSEMLAAN